jgi:hypothetical protein
LGIIDTQFWGSWQEWAEVYALCRRDFLQWYSIRHPGQTPGAELPFAAYQRGQNLEDVVIDRGPDPRRVLALYESGGIYAC